MRRFIKSTALVVVLLFAFMTTTGVAVVPNTTIKAPKLVLPEGCKQLVHARNFAKFAKSVWDQALWERGKPPKSTLDAAEHKRHCAIGDHDKQMKIVWLREKRQYYAYRSDKLKERRERLKYLPYDCGNGIRSAIDCAIMMCESGGSYTVWNASGSGAYGKYQLMEEHWDHLGGLPTPRQQDQIASELWDGGIGRDNWVC